MSWTGLAVRDVRHRSALGALGEARAPGAPNARRGLLALAVTAALALPLTGCDPAPAASPQANPDDAATSESADGTSASAEAENPDYYSSGIPEPDKIASGWLITRHLDPGATVAFLAKDAPAPSDAVPFDLPGATWARQPARSTFETILTLEQIDDPVLITLGDLIRIGEISFWNLEPGTPEERFDRGMKTLAQQDDVPGMYAFLDKLYAAGGEVP